MNERIKELRKALNLTMEKFGARLGVKRNTVSQWESGTNSVTDQVIKSICREFNVDYIWLTTGEGEMFHHADPDDDALVYLSQLIDSKETPLYEMILKIIHTYNQLNEENKKVLTDFMRELLHGSEEKKKAD